MYQNIGKHFTNIRVYQQSEVNK